MTKRILFVSSLFAVITYSCNLFDNEMPPDPYSSYPYLKGNGAFVINEGNYLAGNGSISFFSDDSLKIYNNLFFETNKRPLGDIPNSMVIKGEKAYLIVNNSGKIEVVDIHDMKSIAVIKDLSSPRNMLIVNHEKAYVTSLYSDDISIINLTTNTISGRIKIRRSSEAIVMSGNKVYVSCWTSGNEVLIINSISDRIIDSVQVGHEPESMVLDKDNRLWILCSGGYSGQFFPELLTFNTITDKIEKRFTFYSRNFNPSSLAINGTGDTLYYLGGAIWRMGISESSLPAKPLIPSNGRLLYKIGIQPGTGIIFATNAVDYLQRGYLMRFNSKGVVIDSLKADIIPGTICFKTSSKLLIE